MALTKINFSMSCEDNGDPRAGGWRGSKLLSIFKKNIEKNRIDNKYSSKEVEVNHKQLKHKR